MQLTTLHDRAVRGRRLLSGATFALFVLASLAALTVVAYAPRPAPAATPIAVLASVGFVSEAGEQGLFNVSGLVPGRSVSRCLRVRYGGTTPGGMVYLAATDITGSLATDLRIKVEQGTGGGATGCTGFDGSTLYDGLLTGLADPDPAAPRTTTGWSPVVGDERTYRITATVRDVESAQSKRTTATFSWYLVGAPPGETPVGAPGPTTDPTPGEATVDAMAPTGASAKTTKASVGGTANPGRALVDLSAAPSASAAPPVAASGTEDQAQDVLTNIGQGITRVAARTSVQGAFLVAAMVVLAVFLSGHGRIKRLNPGRALAAQSSAQNAAETPDAATLPEVVDTAALPAAGDTAAGVSTADELRRRWWGGR
jgi:hypothetical protein